MDSDITDKIIKEFDRRELNLVWAERLTRLEVTLTKMEEDREEIVEYMKQITAQIGALNSRYVEQAHIIRGWSRERKLIISLVAAILIFIAQQIGSYYWDELVVKDRGIHIPNPAPNRP